MNIIRSIATKVKGADLGNGYIYLNLPLATILCFESYTFFHTDRVEYETERCKTLMLTKEHNASGNFS